MASANEIVLQLKAENNDLKAKLTETEKSIEKLRKKTQSELNAIVSSFRMVRRGIALAFGSMIIRNLINTAAQIDSVGRSFRNLARNARGGSEELLAAMREASAGTISDLDLMKSANLAIMLSGDQVMQHLPEMARIARAAARATGQDINFMLESLVTATGRQSIMILDNLGISSAVAAQKMEEYARSIGKTRDQLSDAEKKQAFFYAAMAAGRQLVDRVGLSHLTLSERIQILEAQTKSFVGQVAGQLIPALNSLMDSLTSAVTHGTSFANILGRALGIVVTLVTMLIETIKEMPSTFREMGRNILIFNNRIVENFADMMAKINRLLGRNEAAAEWEETANAARRGIEAATAAINEESEANANYGRRMEELFDQLKAYWNGTVSSAEEATTATNSVANAAANAAGNVGRMAQQLARVKYLRFLGADLEADLLQLQNEYIEMIALIDKSSQEAIALGEAYDRRIEEIYMRHSVFMSNLLDGFKQSYQTAFSGFESATKAALYQSLYGKGGWGEWAKAIKDILKQLVVDIMYAIAKALILQAVIGGGAMGGGFFGAAVVPKVFRKGFIPEFSKGRIPVLADGMMPSDHFLAAIGTREAVINAESTRANYALLSAMNQNPGKTIIPDVNVNVLAQVDGNTLFEVVEKRRAEQAKAMGAESYYRRSVYT